MRAWLHRVFLVVLALWATAAGAHELSMAEMAMHQVSVREFLWQWTASGRAPASQHLTPVWPEGCSADGNLVRCGEAGMRGTLKIEGVGKRYSAVMLRIYWLDGQARVYTLTSGQPTVRLYGSADDKRGMGEIASAYTALGIEHILLGVDHLLFVLGLMWLVSTRWMLVKTITSFTIAHSITLAAATLGWVGVPERPVNAAIALSIVFVAVEILRNQRGHAGLTVRYPWIVAFAFGLLHGFGFAGALTKLGLPQENIPAALLFFNIGVEIGQLAFVFVVLALAWAHRTLQANFPRWSAPIPAYAIGTIAMFWFGGRFASILLG